MSTSTDTITDEKVKIDKKVPSKYKVIMLNDDATPIDWVVGLLREIFRHTVRDAETLTMTIHNEGSAVVGTYAFEIAESKVHEAVSVSRDNGFPLALTMEEA